MKGHVLDRVYCYAALRRENQRYCDRELNPESDHEQSEAPVPVSTGCFNRVSNVLLLG